MSGQLDGSRIWQYIPGFHSEEHLDLSQECTQSQVSITSRDIQITEPTLYVYTYIIYIYIYCYRTFGAFYFCYLYSHLISDSSPNSHKLRYQPEETLPEHCNMPCFECHLQMLHYCSLFSSGLYCNLLTWWRTKASTFQDWALLHHMMYIRDKYDLYMPKEIFHMCIHLPMIQYCRLN